MAGGRARMVAMAVLMAAAATARAACNTGAVVAFDCACLEEDRCEKTQKDVCAWAEGKCAAKPCPDITTEDECNVADVRCSWTAGACALVA